MTETTYKPWQKGFPLDALKRLTGTFKAAHKPHVYGAFGLIKERDVADALDKDRVAWITGHDFSLWTSPSNERQPTFGTPTAIMIKQRVGSRGKRVRDFRGETFRVPEGSIYISALAAVSSESGVELMKLYSAPTWDGLYIEIFEEDDVAREVVELMGLQWNATKISAGSEIKGIYSADWSAVNVPPEEAATLVEMQANYLSTPELAALRKELAENAPWAQHYSGYNKRQSWTAFALRGFDPSDPSFIVKPAEMSRGWRKENPQHEDATSGWTDLAAAFPTALEIVRRFVDSDDQIDRLRFMRLSPEKGELSRHADITDREAGVADGKIARLHIPILSSDRVRVFAWTHRGDMIERRFDEGGLYYLDQRKPHRVINEGGKERVHLVADVRSSEKIRTMLRDGYNPTEWEKREAAKIDKKIAAQAQALVDKYPASVASTVERMRSTLR